MLVVVVSRRTVGMGIMVVAVLEVVRPLVLLVIVVTLLLVLPARSAAKWGILSFDASIGWMSPIKMNLLLRHWRLLTLTRLIQIGTATQVPLIISPMTG